MFADLLTRRPAVAAHGIRVGTLCADLAADLHFNSQAQVIALVAGALHDVGKVDVPTAILEKPSALTADEVAAIRPHPTIGERMIRAYTTHVDYRDVSRIAMVVGQHHERFDGGGYPSGLFGAQIDPLARVVSIVDAYFAMTEGRPYVRTMGESEAREELRANAGTQFDPQVVEAFLACRVAL